MTTWQTLVTGVHVMLDMICLLNSSLPPSQAFTIIDQNRDGIISKDDLRDVLASMGEQGLHLRPVKILRTYYVTDLSLLKVCLSMSTMSYMYCICVYVFVCV